MKTASVDFRSVHGQFRPKVLRYLARLVGESDAEDLTQAVMLKVSEGLPAFRGESSISTWVYRIATNAALDRLRAKRERAGESESEFDEEALPDSMQTASAETNAIREEMNACIREFVERLPQGYRTVMVLSEIEGFKNSEIADILGIRVETVKIRLHRAREKLHQELEAGCSFHRDECDELACDRKPSAIVFHRPR